MSGISTNGLQHSQPTAQHQKPNHRNKPTQQSLHMNNFSLITKVIRMMFHVTKDPCDDIHYTYAQPLTKTILIFFQTFILYNMWTLQIDGTVASTLFVRVDEAGSDHHRLLLRISISRIGLDWGPGPATSVHRRESICGSFHCLLLVIRTLLAYLKALFGFLRTFPGLLSAFALFYPVFSPLACIFLSMFCSSICWWYQRSRILFFGRCVLGWGTIH